MVPGVRCDRSGAASHTGVLQVSAIAVVWLAAPSAVRTQPHHAGQARRRRRALLSVLAAALPTALVRAARAIAAAGRLLLMLPLLQRQLL